MQLILVRHGHTGPEFEGRYIGRSDVPVWSGGVDQIKGLAGPINEFRPRLCRVSPLLRARQSADYIGNSGLAKFEIDEDLREVDFGAWEGQSFVDISRKDPGLVRGWAAGREDFSFPQGDKLADFRRRVVRRADYYTSLDVATVLLVTHGGVIRSMICHLLGIPMDRYLVFDVAPASITVLESFEKGSAVLKGLNLTQG